MKKAIIIFIIIVIVLVLITYLLPNVILGTKVSFFSKYQADEKCYGLTFSNRCLGIIKSPVIN